MSAIRHDWQTGEIEALFEKPFNDLLFQAQTVHRQYFDPNQVQVSTLLSIKTGACPEDCAYCPQAAQYDTGVAAEKLMSLDAVLADGSVIKTGGRARKSAAGYDLTRLLVGAEGTLGLITELTLRLSGIPEAISAAVCPFPTVEAAWAEIYRDPQAHCDEFRASRATHKHPTPAR